MNAASITIRAAVFSDTAALTELIYQSKQSNGYSDLTMKLFARDDALRITPARLSKHPFWVAETDGRIIGCVALDPHDGKAGEIRTFFIAPDHLRRGVGRLLWQVLLPTAQSQGFTRLNVNADPNSAPFYEALGFVTVEMRSSNAISGRMIPHMVCDI